MEISTDGAGPAGRTKRRGSPSDEVSVSSAGSRVNRPNSTNSRHVRSPPQAPRPSSLSPSHCDCVCTGLYPHTDLSLPSLLSSVTFRCCLSGVISSHRPQLICDLLGLAFRLLVSGRTPRSVTSNLTHIASATAVALSACSSLGDLSWVISLHFALGEATAH